MLLLVRMHLCQELLVLHLLQLVLMLYLQFAVNIGVAVDGCFDQRVLLHFYTSDLATCSDS